MSPTRTRTRSRQRRRLAAGIATVVALVSTLPLRAGADELDPPWREAGLEEREAAAHALDRLTYGARPRDVERVLEIGLDRWLALQIEASLPEPELEGMLAGFSTLALDIREFPEVYPNPGRVMVEARAAGVIDPDFQPDRGDTSREQREARGKLLRFAREKGYRWQQELLEELMAQKVVRAVYAENQLAEVLTDFWFNHFNVSITDIEARGYVLAYERDAIRPNVLGEFRDLLGATAKHPAMLIYLDNARSTAAEDDPTTMDSYLADLGRGRRGRYGRGAGAGRDRPKQLPGGRNRPKGLNENYARELLELHTLGVEGGYSQEDVVEVARAFTGWTIYPPRPVRELYGRKLERALSSGAGFVAEGGFLFRADAHDAGPKKVLGERLPAGRGLKDGETVLDLVAAHPSTARHLARKLAVRFVSDEPSEKLVDRLAGEFARGGGDLERVMRALVESPEFWSPEARREKIKSPFELAVSALRILDAEIRGPREMIEWISRMGQPLYAYQAPTGYPDRADFWVNTGSLLNRMNFGLALAAGRIDRVEIDLLALNDGREPESRRDALETYLPLLLPERDVDSTLALIEPLVLQPGLAGRVDEVAPVEEPEPPGGMTGPVDEESLYGQEERPRPSLRTASLTEPSPLEQVVGVILGSPEFQRR